MTIQLTCGTIFSCFRSSLDPLAGITQRDSTIWGDKLFVFTSIQLTFHKYLQTQQSCPFEWYYLRKQYRQEGHMTIQLACCRYSHAQLSCPFGWYYLRKQYHPEGHMTIQLTCGTIFSCLVVLSLWQVLPKEIVPSGGQTVCIHEYSAHIS